MVVKLSCPAKKPELAPGLCVFNSALSDEPASDKTDNDQNDRPGITSWLSSTPWIPMRGTTKESSLLLSEEGLDIKLNEF